MKGIICNISNLQIFLKSCFFHRLAAKPLKSHAQVILSSGQFWVISLGAWFDLDWKMRKYNFQIVPYFKQRLQFKALSFVHFPNECALNFYVNNQCAMSPFQPNPNATLRNASLQIWWCWINQDLWHSFQQKLVISFRMDQIKPYHWTLRWERWTKHKRLSQCLAFLTSSPCPDSSMGRDMKSKEHV